ncbi:MAG: hypothetical protein EOO38_09080 [Cytophagaceae bacterium]|nr:MAG: hypothetical protein EOO38_09080 [Cytophagaceae bacterium]
MKSGQKRAAKAAVVLATAAILSGCFGGGDDDDNNSSVTSEVPVSASQSIAGFIAYLKELVVASADMLEPVDITTVTAPADNTSEPETL